MCKIKTMLIRAILLSYRNKECHQPTAVATIINFHPTSLHPPRAQVSNHFNSCPTICMTYLNLNKALNFELILNLNKKKWLEIKFIFQILKQNLWLNTDRVPSTQWYGVNIYISCWRGPDTLKIIYTWIKLKSFE